MAVTAARVTGVQDTVIGNKRMHTRKLTFSSDYPTGGEPVTASMFGLRSLEQVILQGGVAMAAALTTGNPVGYNAETGKIVFYDSADDGDPPDEKPVEAHLTGCFIYATGIGT